MQEEGEERKVIIHSMQGQPEQYIMDTDTEDDENEDEGIKEEDKRENGEEEEECEREVSCPKCGGIIDAEFKRLRGQEGWMRL